MAGARRLQRRARGPLLSSANRSLRICLASRKWSISQAPPQPDAPRAGETFALLGIVMREDVRVAFLRDTVDGRSYTASPGANMAGWRVERIDQRCVALRRGRRTQQLCL